MKSTTLYTTIFEKLRDEIITGKYARDFPSEMKLVERFAASRHTVIRAMSELVKAGLIERRRGSGTVVSRKIRQKLGQIGLVAPYFKKTAFVDAIARICRREGYSLVTGEVSQKPMSREACKDEALRLAREFVETGVSGILMQPLQSVASADSLNTAMLRAFRMRGIPVVLVDHDIVDRPEQGACDIVGIDNFRSGYSLGKYLVHCGATRIAFLMRAHWAPTVSERMRGVSAAVVEAGQSWNPQKNIFACEADDEKSLAAYIRRFHPDAIACGNDLDAAKLLRTLKKFRIAVPSRVMVTGFDDLPASAQFVPALTTVRQVFSDLAEVAADVLFRRMADPNLPVVTISLPTKLIVRESTKCPE